MVKMNLNLIFLLGVMIFHYVLSEGDDSTCGPSCLFSTETPAGPACNETSGECLNGCVSGYTGAQCLIPCGENCVNCSISDGTDNETECHQCENGHYGLQCDNKCNSNCLFSATSDLPICDSLDGTCTFGCKDTYYGPRCDRRCSNKCKQSLCERDGVCSVGCIFPMLGGPKCDQSCPKGCDGRDSECDQQFRCVIGCKFNYWGPTCQPCSEECTNSTSPETVARCLESDGFCQFGCSVGKYGHTCSETCPRHCKDVICTQTSGECHTCTKGYFGNYCNSTCSSNCPDNDCYPDNGTCVADTCLLTQHAWYGPSCDLRCPETCKNRVCDKYSWYCLDGCVTGYFGNSCNLGQPSTEIEVSPSIIDLGTSGTFRCISTSTTIPATHNLTIKASWFVNNTSVESIGRFQIDGEDLIIHYITRRDIDLTVSCKAVEERDLTTLVNMTVPVGWGPDSVPELQPPNTFYNLDTGTHLPSINCSSDCNPPCELRWKKIGTQRSLSTNGVLSLGKLERISSGEYVCIATRNQTYKTGRISIIIFIKEDTPTADFSHLPTTIGGITQTFSQNYTPVAVVGGVLGAAMLSAFVVIVVYLRQGSWGAVFKSSTASKSESTTAEMELQNITNYEGLSQRNNASPTYDELNLGMAIAGDKCASKTTTSGEKVYENTNITDK